MVLSRTLTFTMLPFPFFPDRTKHGKAFVDACMAHGVQHAVIISMAGAGRSCVHIFLAVDKHLAHFPRNPSPLVHSLL